MYISLTFLGWGIPDTYSYNCKESIEAVGKIFTYDTILLRIEKDISPIANMHDVLTAEN